MGGPFWTEPIYQPEFVESVKAQLVSRPKPATQSLNRSTSLIRNDHPPRTTIGPWA